MKKNTDISSLSSDEKKILQEFSLYFEKGDYEMALSIAKQALLNFPESQPIWDNQIGALVFAMDADYVKAFEHYQLAFLGGFDFETCEYNMWEAAEELFNFLKTDNEGFNAILSIDDANTPQSIKANHLIKKYIALFPKGDNINKANQLMEEFTHTTA